MPIELLSLTDRFIDSLSAKIHPTPPTADKLSVMFQDFYVLASSHVSTHISLMASQRRGRGSRSPSVSSSSSSVSKGVSRSNTINVKERDSTVSDKFNPAQQMLTTAEIEERRRARQQLENKRHRLEEALERRVCEAVHDRIWRHRSTQDEERDEKLRSRTAALDVLGIRAGELGIEIGHAQEDEVRGWLDGARDELLKMNDEKHPLGKLLHLKAAHKAIVDTLSRLHSSSSSADEILPTLIYTLITTRPEGTNIISNLFFVQRFRAASKIDGEAAYALTNLEAAISFLENVDIATLRADEATSARASTDKLADASHPTPLTRVEVRPEMTNAVSSPTIMTTSASALVEVPSSTSTPSHHRRISELLQPPASALSAAGDAVLSQADHGLKTIGNTLDFSYGVLFGRLRERRLGDPAADDAGFPVIPKTLDEARKMVSTPPPADVDGGALQASAQVDGAAGPSNDKLLSLVGGSKMNRERSSDSARSGGSGQNVGTGDEIVMAKSPLGPPTSAPNVVAAGTMPAAAPGRALSPAMESMKSFGNSLNPLNRIAGVNAMLSFGRSHSSSPPPSSRTPPTALALPINTTKSSTVAASAIPDAIHKPGGPDKAADDAKATQPSPPDAASTGQENGLVMRPTATVPVVPPIQRFMELENPGELRINEVLELLRDYRRLAGVLQDLHHFG